MMVVADINETFVPLSDGFLVDPHESRDVIEPFLDGLVDMFANNRVAEATLGAAIECAQLALKDKGGKVIAFHTCLPTLGPGTLKNRDNMKQLGTEKEKQLFVPQDPFYEKLAQTCVDNGVSVDLFLAPHHMVDLTTIGLLSSISGGETYFYPGFEISKDGNKLNGDLSELLSHPFGFNGVMRVRCSDGLVIDEHVGNFYNRNSSDLELGGIDSEKSITVLFKHESKLDEKSEVSFQCALLYTTQEGQRRIRVHNLSIPVTTLIGNAFKYADMDTIVSVLIKLSIANSAEAHLKLVRDQFTEQCVKILTGYRKNCAQGTAPGQLILPEALKLLPLLANGALKLKALRSGLDVTLDSRVYYMRLLKGLPVSSIIRLLYPNVYELHNMALEVGEPNHNGRIILPNSVRASYTNLDPSGAYLLENGDQSFIWLGRQVKSEFLQAAFGVSSLEQIDTKATELPVLSSNVNEQIRKVVNAIQTQRSRSISSIQIVRQQLDQRELEFCNLLIEDKNLDNMSYIDHLCHIHRQIQIEVSRT
jgi:protein transport protein SEC24